ncbi:MAG: FGGY family carbohydrate kinase, partial [Candidatus Latescibacteria bacterium]|nr:FGGY family carbohydrate kinase [Candidatus Latescibacterota bacterium]
MARFLGLDVGTTTLTALVLEVDTGEVVTVRTAPNTCEVTSAEGRARGRSEWDAAQMAELAREVAAAAVAAGGTVDGIGVTGQMHGMLLLSDGCRPLGPYVGWQDQRGNDPMGRGPETYVGQMQALSEETGALHRGCRPAAGYLGTTLYWMATNDLLPEEPFVASFMPDMIAASLTDTQPVTDATNAAGSGFFDAIDRGWREDLIDALGLSTDILPDVRASCERAGGLSSEAARATGMPAGTPVAVACGDNQASFAGSVGDYEQTLLINVGTGGQVSARVPRPTPTEELEARPHMDGGYLLVGAGLVGGRSYAWLRDFFRQVGEAFFGGTGDEDLYEVMNRLAATVPAGADGLRCEPLFT